MIIIGNKPNKDLRILIQESGVPQYEIARRCGVGEGSLCRWLRYELPADDERRQLILKAIKEGGQGHE